MPTFEFEGAIISGEALRHSETVNAKSPLKKILQKIAATWGVIGLTQLVKHFNTYVQCVSLNFKNIGQV